MVNNAGFIKPGPFLSLRQEDIDRQVQINLLGPLRVLHHFLPTVPNGGSVVNIVSMAGILPLADNSIYTAGKFGMRASPIRSRLNCEAATLGWAFIPQVWIRPCCAWKRKTAVQLNFVSDP